LGELIFVVSNLLIKFTSLSYLIFDNLALKIVIVL